MRQRLPRWGPSVVVAVAVLALAAWSFSQRWQLLTGSPFPLGVDGYFYPIQLRSLLAHGELAYPASPLAFYLLAPFAAVTDPITGTKLGAALFGAAIAGPAYGVGARLGGGRGAGLVAAVLATTSLGSAYLTIEFVKNGIGLTVALTALWLVLRATERPSRSRIGAAIAGLCAACATRSAGSRSWPQWRSRSARCSRSASCRPPTLGSWVACSRRRPTGRHQRWCSPAASSRSDMTPSSGSRSR